MKYAAKLLNNINQCFIPKLSKNLEESPNHAEFDVRNNNLDANFEPLSQCLIDLQLKANHEAATIISSLYILYHELNNSNSPWNNEKTVSYAKKLNFYFEVLTNVPLELVLIRKSTFDVQEIYDKILEMLHNKLTPEDFKKYPGLLGVFVILIANMGNYKVQIKPQEVFPVILQLTDDYVPYNKMKGLHCFLLTLQAMNPGDFERGNYYEVLFRCLKRSFTEKNRKITSSTHSCLKELCKMLPNDVKHSKLDNLYSDILEQIMSESNIYRKAECLKFAKFVIRMHGINCISKSNFKVVICNCLEQCVNDFIANIMLLDTLACLDEWVVQCWCIWRLSSDYKIISTLLKILYVCKGRMHVTSVQRIIVILICLNKESDRKHLLASLDKANTINNDEFKQRVKQIKQNCNY